MQDRYTFTDPIVGNSERRSTRPPGQLARHVLIEPIRFIADCDERTKRQFASVALNEPIFRRSGSSGSAEQLRTSERCGQIACTKKCERAAHQRYFVRILC